MQGTDQYYVTKKLSKNNNNKKCSKLHSERLWQKGYKISMQ